MLADMIPPAPSQEPGYAEAVMVTDGAAGVLSKICIFSGSEAQPEVVSVTTTVYQPARTPVRVALCALLLSTIGEIVDSPSYHW